LQVQAVELLPEVARASAEFSSVLESERRPRIAVADARRFVRASSERYDVIVADLFHPARSGAGALYSAEHFGAVRERLADAGLFCQWLPLHQLDLQTLRSIVGAFLVAYPRATALLATNSLDTPVVGLIGQRAAQGFSAAEVHRRTASVAQVARLSALHLDDEFAVLGSFIAGPAALHAWAAGAELNTDDQPVVAERAPLLAYAPRSTARQRLVELLRALDPEPAEVLVAPDAADLALARRLAAYWVARDRFIELGTSVAPSADPAAMLAQLQNPLLEMVRASPEFRPAYDPLLNMARALSARDAGQARGLLAELARAQPARPEAGQVLDSLLPRGPAAGLSARTSEF
jgi:spermidine synthase